MRGAVTDGQEKGRKVSKFRLQEREFEVLLALDVWGILGMGQLEGLFFWTGTDAVERERLFFNEYDRGAYDRYCYKRLVKLEDSGFVQQVGVGSSRIYALSRKGKTALEQAGMPGRTDFRRSWSGSVRPDFVRVNGVGLTLARLLGAGVVSRHQLATAARAQGLHEAQIKSRIPDLRIEGQVPMAMVVGRFFDWAKEIKRWLSGEKCLWLYLTGSDFWRDAVVNNAKSAGVEHVLAAEEREFRERLGNTVFTGPKRITTLRELIGQQAAGAA